MDAALNKAETAYLNVEIVDHRVDLRQRLDMFAAAVHRGRPSFDAADWRDEFVPVARGAETGPLVPAVRAMAEARDRPLIAHGVAAGLSVLLDCLLRLPETPVDSAVASLVAAVESGTREQLAAATEAVATVARSTGLCCRALEATADLEFVHPDTSAHTVRAAARAAHEAGDTARLAEITAEAERSAGGEWTETNLRGYADEHDSGRPFERLLANLWLNWGYDEAAIIDDTGGDGGVDVVATTDDRTVGIEAKRYDECTLRVAEVRRLAGVLPQYDFDRVYLVTSTTDVTDDARTEAARADDFQLVTGETLAERLSESSLPPPVFVE